MSVKAEKKGNVYWLVLDNVRRKNCISHEMYAQIVEGMDEADNDPEVFITVFTGAGDYYSSGNDFSPESIARDHGADPDSHRPYYQWVQRLIRHKKLLVALCNGPAFGIACTTLGLFDYVVCADHAYFETPFPSIGVCPEGCSSYTFPKLFGTLKANEMLLFGQRISPSAALSAGLVAQVWPKDQFKQKATAFIDKISQLPPHSVLASKRLVRNEKLMEEMYTANRREEELLKKLMKSEETMNLIAKRFMSKQ